MKESLERNWKIPLISNQQLTLNLKAGDRLFTVGVNGSGKSALIQHLFSLSRGVKVKRIAAHRQTWLESGSVDFTPASRREFEQDNISYEKNWESRWKDFNARKKLNAVLFDLIAKSSLS